MKQHDYNRISRWYSDFVSSYGGKDQSLHPTLQLKLNHSRRVAADCRAMAAELGWPDDEVLTAETVGLLHDVARFPQFTEFKTFLDHRSFDHGERGYRIIAESRLLSALDSRDECAILNGIRFHNRKDIEPGLDPDSVRFLNLVRDADKIDIIKIVNETILNKSYRDYPEILCHIDIDGPPTPALIEEIRTHGFGSYAHVHSMADMNLIRMTWVYNIVYAPALRRLSERKLLVQLDDAMQTYPAIRDLMASALKFVEDKLEQ